MKKKTRINWHAGFVSAMKLDLIENEDDLQYSPEYYLTGKHQRIDLLIIKNEGSAVIRNPIGAGFSRYNICEYKSPGDSLTYGDFFKILAYTGLYLDERERHGDYKISDYTTTFVKKEVDQKMCQAVNELFADEIKLKDAIIADKDALIANQTSLLADKDSLLADKDSLLADKDAIIAKLQAELEQYTNNVFKQQNN